MVQHVAYVSGHIDLTKEQFDTYYKAPLDKAIDDRHWFIVGNARGADEFALQYLKDKGVPKDRVLVYYYSRGENNPKQLRRNQCRGFPLSDGFRSYTHRDECATRDSTYDILWVRGAEATQELCKQLGIRYDQDRISGTEKNVLRRQAYYKNI